MADFGSGRTKGNTDMEELFDDVMKYAKKKVIFSNQRRTINNEEDLRHFLIDMDSQNAFHGSRKTDRLLNRLLKTENAKEIYERQTKITGKFFPTQQRIALTPREEIKINLLREKKERVFILNDYHAARQANYQNRKGKIVEAYRRVETGRFVSKQRIIDFEG